MTERRFPVVLTLSTGLALAILIALGAWQLQRLAWKQQLIARIAALEAAPAAPAGPALERLAAGADLDFSRVRLTCPGLGQAGFLELYAVREGQAGVRLVSACAVDGGPYRTLLVDRGFVADTISARPSVDPAARGPVTLVGVLRAPEPANRFTPPNDPAANRWYSRDVAAMARALDAPSPAPLMLMAEASSNPQWKALVPAPLPGGLTNRHLEYALTWFGLAAALAGVYAALLWRKWKA